MGKRTNLVKVEFYDGSSAQQNPRGKYWNRLRVRYFGGKRYFLLSSYRSKSKANKDAEALRRRSLVRMTHSKEDGWLVWEGPARKDEAKRRK